MSRIPMTADVAELVGEQAEKVENRSLLLDKFVFHKSWPVQLDERDRPVKWDDASRWSFIRVTEGGTNLLNAEAGRKRDESQKPGKDERSREKLAREAAIARSLANVKWDSRDLATLRAKHTLRFLGLFRTAYGDRSDITVGQLEGRLAINLAEGLIQNAGIALDRLFGMPFIPGSAVKGVCRHAALLTIRNADGNSQQAAFDFFRRIFGTADTDFVKGDLAPFCHLLGGNQENQKGAVAFLPAYPVNEAKLVVDITTVHYPEYYRTGKSEALSDENLRPNSFPVVEAGAQFAFCLVLNGMDTDPALITQAKHWMDEALTVHGIGAKTAAGYGWFSLQPAVLDGLLAAERRETEALERKLKAEAEARAKSAAEAQRLATLSPVDRYCDLFKQLKDDPFANKANELESLSPDEQRAFLQTILSQEKKETWKKWKKSDKTTAKARVEILIKLARQHGVNLP